MKSIFQSTNRSRRHRQAQTPEPEQEQQAPFFNKSGGLNDVQSKPQPFFQAKLSIGQPDDAYEREADTVADKVVNGGHQGAASVQAKEISSVQRLATPDEEKMPATNDGRMREDKMIQEKPMVQRAEAPKEEEQPVQKMDAPKEEEQPVQKMDAPKEEEQPVQKMDAPKEEEQPVQKMEAPKEEEKPVQKMDAPKEEEKPVQKATANSEAKSNSNQASPDFSARLSARKGGGAPLPDASRAQMEQGIGADFSGVRVHTDSEAERMNDDIHAQAFTHGQDVYFNSGKYSPESKEGQRLLAHELTHVVQQGGGAAIQKSPAPTKPILKSARFQGDLFLEKVARNEAVLGKGNSSGSVTKVQQALEDAGFKLPKFGTDGHFGKETQSAVIKYQTTNSLSPDGLVGKDTIKHLDNRPAEVVPIPAEDQDREIGTLKLHADTETKNRSELTQMELLQSKVGHTWVSLETDKIAAASIISEPTKTLLQTTGKTAFGFWPLINRASAFTKEEQTRIDKGQTPGAGASIDPVHEGFSLVPDKNVPGRVEEPDDAHTPKGTKEYKIKLAEMENLMTYINLKRNAPYNLYKYNCTTFALEAVQSAGKTVPGGLWNGIAMPNALYRDIYQMYLKGDKSVTVAPLGPDESHAGEKPPSSQNLSPSENSKKKK